MFNKSPSEKIVLSPTHYSKYVDRLKQTRADQENRKSIERNKPGSGLIWKNQTTVPIEPNLKTNRLCNRTDLRNQVKLTKTVICCWALYSLINMYSS